MNNGLALKGIWRDLALLGLLATLSLCLGLLVNQLRDKPLSLLYKSKAQRLDAAVAEIQKGEPTAPASALPTNLSLEEFKAFVQQKRGLVFDARPEIFYRLGHVPGALSLPRDDFENAYAKWQSRLVDKNQPLAVYCAESACEDSVMVQSALIKLGYTQVAVFRGGWGDWTNAALPEEKSAP